MVRVDWRNVNSVSIGQICQTDLLGSIASISVESKICNRSNKMSAVAELYLGEHKTLLEVTDELRVVTREMLL